MEHVAAPGDHLHPLLLLELAEADHAPFLPYPLSRADVAQNRQSEYRGGVEAAGGLEATSPLPAGRLLTRAPATGFGAAEAGDEAVGVDGEEAEEEDCEEDYERRHCHGIGGRVELGGGFARYCRERWWGGAAAVRKQSAVAGFHGWGFWVSSGLILLLWVVNIAYIYTYT